MTAHSNLQGAEAVVVGLSLNGLGVVRCLGRAGIRVIGLAEGAISHTGRSRYVRRVTTWDPKEHGSLIHTLLMLADGAPRRVLLVTGDDHVQTISAHREQLAPHYLFLVPPEEDTRRLINKASFLMMAKQHGLDVPSSEIACSSAEFPCAVERTGLPCVIKPQEKASEFDLCFGSKALICHSEEDVQNVSQASYSFHVPLLVQEWIPGSDNEVYFTLHYFNRNSECLVSFAGRKIRQSPPRVGHTASAEPVDSQELIEKSNRFFRAVNMVGLCSMEFKRDARTGRFLAIEPTIGRTDWQSAIADINGVPIALAAYCDLSELEPPSRTDTPQLRKWVEFEGDLRSALYYRRMGELTLAEWCASLHPFCPAVAASDDPVPVALFATGLFFRAVRKPLRIVRRLIVNMYGSFRSIDGSKDS